MAMPAMIDRFCVVFRVLFAFDVKLRNLNYSLFKAYSLSLTISTNTKKLFDTIW